MDNKNFNNAKKEARVSKIPSNVSLKHLKEPDIDTLTYPKSVETNNKLATALKVKSTLEFKKYFTFLNAALKPEDTNVKDTKFNKLISSNKQILSVLKKIEANQFDEQDTSIKHKDKSNSVVINNYYGNEKSDSESSNGSGFDSSDLVPGLPLRKPPKPKPKKPKPKKPKPKKPKPKTPKTKTPKAYKKPKTKTPKTKTPKTKTPKTKTTKAYKKPNNKSFKSRLKETIAEKTSKFIRNTEKSKISEKARISENTEKAKISENAKSVQKTETEVVKKAENSKISENTKSVQKPETEVVKKADKIDNSAKTSKNTEKLSPQQEKAVLENAKKISKKTFTPTKVAKCLERFVGRAGAVATVVSIGAGVYDYVNAECDADRQDAVANAVGAAAGALAGAQLGGSIGAAVGVWFWGIGAVPGAFVGSLVGGTIGGIAGSDIGLWLSDQFKTPLDLIPDKFTNQGPEVEYVFITTKLLPLLNRACYTDNAEYESDSQAVADRLTVLEAEIKKGSTQEQRDEWSANRFKNDNIVETHVFDKDEIKDWAKVNSLSDSDLKILESNYSFSDLDEDRIAEIKFRREAKTQNKHQSTVSSLDSINDALNTERKRLEDAKKDVTYDSNGGFSYNDPGAIERSKTAIEQLQKTKHTLLNLKGPYAENNANDYYNLYENNNNTTKRFQSSIQVNTRQAELLSEKGIDSKSFNNIWASNYSKRADISSDIIKDFNSIKAQDIEFNTSDHLGFVSGEFESGGNPGTVAKDNFGYAYGAWQMNSQKGILPKFVESLRGDEKFGRLAELEIDSPEFQKEWVTLAKKYPNEFLQKQHECISKNLFTPVYNFAKSAGIDVSNRAVQEALWSQAVQHGLDGNKKIITDAASKLSPNSTPEDIVRALYSSRANYMSGLSTLDSGLKIQLNERYRTEASKALAVASNDDYQNSAVTKTVASDNFDGSNVDIETITEERQEDAAVEKNVSLFQNLVNPKPEPEISKPEVSPEVSAEDIKAELRREKAELQAIIQLKNDGKFDEAEKRLNQLKKDKEKTAKLLAKVTSGDPEQEVLNVTPVKRDNVKIQDIDGNNVDNMLMMKAAENANSKSTQRSPLNLPVMNSQQSSEKSERNSFDLTKPTIPFVN